MSGRGGLPFALHEKNELLAGIIIANGPSPSLLLNVILSNNMSTRLDDVALPTGRSFNSCRNAFEAIRRDAQMAPGPMGIQIPSPVSAPLASKRPNPFENPQPGRQLAPKPTTGGPYGPPVSQIEQPAKKRRGRPPKTDKTRAETQSMGGEPSSAVRTQFAMPPMATPMTAQPPELPQPVQTPVEERRKSQPAVSRMNISSMLAATPTGPGSGSHSSSSSGKRRRGRSTRAEPGEVPPAGTAGGGEQFPPYESPYPRIGGEEGLDSPARAAMMRRREEPQLEEQQWPGGQQQPPPPPGYQSQQQYQQPPQE